MSLNRVLIGFSTVLVALMSWQGVTAQQLRNCGNTVHQHEKRQISWSSQFAGCSAVTDTTDTTIYKIPVVVHIIHNGEPIGTGANIADQRVYDQIRILNEDYRRQVGTNGYNNNPVGADARIEFVLAGADTLGNPFSGIVRVNGGQSSWSLGSTGYKQMSYFRCDRFLNVWVVDLGNFLGFSQWPISNFPGLSGLATPADSAKDGVVINYRYFGLSGRDGGFYNLGRTLTHELGHYFGLFHVWADDPTCFNTDYISDTPTQAGEFYGCPVNPRNSCISIGVGPDQKENYMQYTDDRCMNLFTKEQVKRMRGIIQTSKYRCQLPTSPVLSLNKTGHDNSISLYPNPLVSGNQLTIQGLSKVQIKSVKVFDVLGRMVAIYTDLNNSLSELTLELPRLATGIYSTVIEPVAGNQIVKKLKVQ